MSEAACEWSRRVLASIASPRRDGSAESDEQLAQKTLDKFEADLCAWLGALGLDEHRAMVLMWCEERDVASFFQLPDFSLELAALVGLEPADALSLKCHAKSAWEAVLANKLATAALSVEELLDFGGKLADLMGLTFQEAVGLWMRTADVFAAMYDRWCSNRTVSFSTMEPIDFLQELAEGLQVTRAEAQSFWSKACTAYTADSKVQSSEIGESSSRDFQVVSKPGASPSHTCAKQILPRKSSGPLHGSPSRLRQPSRSTSRPGCTADSRPSLPDSPLRRSRRRPEWDASWEEDQTKHPSQQNYFDSSHRQPQYTIMHFRKDSEPASDAARRRKRPEWNTSWKDSSKMHSSQQKFFDSLHNQSQYSLMHFRKSCPKTTPEQQWWGAESKWWNTGSPTSITSRSPSSPTSITSRSPSRNRACSTPCSPCRALSSPSLPRVGSQVSVLNSVAPGKRQKVFSQSKPIENIQGKGQQRNLHRDVHEGSALPVLLARREHDTGQLVSGNDVHSTVALQSPRPAWEAMTHASECNLTSSEGSAATIGEHQIAECCHSSALGSAAKDLYLANQGLADQTGRWEELDFENALSALRTKRNSLIVSATALDRYMERHPKS